MSQRAEFQIQVLERLGVPLMTAVGSVSARMGVAPDMRADATRLAELISRTVQMSVSLSESMDIRDDQGQADGLRLALAGLSAPLVAGAYEMTGHVPAEGDIGRLASTLGAVLAFADNFTPAADATARLNALEAGPYTGGPDEPQIHIQALFALVPVIQAIGVYSFGRPEKKLVQDVSATVLDRATAMCGRMLGPNATLAQKKKAELSIVRALCLLYAQCHAMETSRLMMMDDASRNAMIQQSGGQVPMDAVWAAFDRGAEMLTLTAEAVVPGAGAASGGASVPRPSAPVMTPPVTAPAAAPVRAPAEPPANPTGSPMGFFAGKKAASGEDTGE